MRTLVAKRNTHCARDTLAISSAPGQNVACRTRLDLVRVTVRARVRLEALRRCRLIVLVSPNVIVTLSLTKTVLLDTQ